MDFKKFLASWEGTRSENKFNRLVIGGLIGLSAVLAFHAVQKNSTVVIAPPEMTKAVSVSRDGADQDYLETFSVATAILLGNVTPDNAEFVKKALGPLLDPGIYNDVMRALDRQIIEIKDNRITSRFSERSVVYEKETGKFFVTGYRVVKGPASDEKREVATYEYEWRVRNFRPLLTFVTNYAGNPQTKKEIERRDQLEERAKRLDEARQRKQHQE